jgi:hypothetical protein
MPAKNPGSRAAKAKKSPASPKKGRRSTQAIPEERLVLEGLLDSLEPEDLAFLVAQARVLIHNREAAKAADELESLARSQAGSQARAAAAPDIDPIHIVRSASGNANLVLGGEFKLLTPEELSAMAKIAIADGSEAERQERLFRWLDRERRDILIDGGMRSPSSPRLAELLAYLEKTFAKHKAARG